MMDKANPTFREWLDDLLRFAIINCAIMVVLLVGMLLMHPAYAQDFIEDWEFSWEPVTTFEPDASGYIRPLTDNLFIRYDLDCDNAGTIWQGTQRSQSSVIVRGLADDTCRMYAFAYEFDNRTGELKSKPSSQVVLVTKKRLPRANPPTGLTATPVGGGSP